MVLLAHSAQKDAPAQMYHDHVQAVYRDAVKKCKEVLTFFSGSDELRTAFYNAVDAGAFFHDLGKVDVRNQDVLIKLDYGGRLPLNHTDAGAAWLLQNEVLNGALLVYCHHRGLYSYSEELKKRDGTMAFRDIDIAEKIDGRLADYITKHCREVSAKKLSRDTYLLKGLSLRIALSCLVDADHSDTACHYGGEFPENGKVETKWPQRLELLNRYVAGLSGSSDKSERDQLRDEVYQACLQAPVAPVIKYCDAPVGTGKTTAVMAHLLSVAAKKNLRHIFVVLPYTNIIEQSVAVYREALVLNGEKPEKVVAAHYHRADFSDLRSRQLATLWRAPIIVTSAVQFFETLASSRTSRLRKLHELPGSAIFIDEAHAAMPLHLWPQQWAWLRELGAHWSAHFVLASGSLVKFWEHSTFSQSKDVLQNLLPEGLHEKVMKFEGGRVCYPVRNSPMNREELVEFVLTKPGPRLVILNTVQSAAVIAHEMKKLGVNVLHLSTALTPKDRTAVIDLINRYLARTTMPEWTLVATSCVEAGVDFSFKTAFRESCSVTSLIQTGGRANRHGQDRHGEIIDFRTRDPFLNKHPAFEVSRMVLDQIFDESLLNTMSPDDVATEAVFRELGRTDILNRAGIIRKQENRQEYKKVEKLCRIIDADTRSVVIRSDIIRKLKNREKISSLDLLQNSVQLWSNKIYKLDLQEFEHYPELYHWGTYPYDPNFLGYMEGLLPMVYEYEDDEYGLVI